MLSCQLCPGHLWVVRGYPVDTPAPTEHLNTQWVPQQALQHPVGTVRPKGHPVVSGHSRTVNMHPVSAVRPDGPPMNTPTLNA